MPRDYSSTHNLCAVSTDPETETMPTRNVDLLLLSSMNDTPSIIRNRLTNSDEKTGDEEPSRIYETISRFEMPLTFERAQAQHFAFLFFFGLGAIAKEENTGYAVNTMTPLEKDYNDRYPLPSFTLKTREGDTVGMTTYSGVFVDELTARFETDSFAKLTAQLKGTGMQSNPLRREEFVVNGNANLEIDLSGKPVLDGKHENIHKVEVYVGNAWREVSIESLSTNGATLNIYPRAELQEGTDYTYRVYYLENSFASVGGNIPETPLFETPLFISDVQVRAGGAWNGVSFEGGHAIDTDLKSLEYNLNNQLRFETGFNAVGSYANRVYREGRTQTIKMDKNANELLLRAYHDYNEEIGLRIKAEGADIPNTESAKYALEMIFPKVGFTSHERSTNDKVNAESLSLTVLKTRWWPSVIVKVTTKLYGELQIM